MVSIKNEIKRIKNLPAFRNLNDDELELMILQRREKDKISRRLKKEAKLMPPTKPSLVSGDLDVEADYTNNDEKWYAKELLRKYLKDFSIESVSDKNLLRNLIYLEVFQKCRLQMAAEDIQKSTGSVPLQILDSIHRNLDKIVALKGQLGLIKGQKQQDAYNSFELLMKKAKIWRESNQASREALCPHCSKKILFKIRTEGWELAKHPFFKDRILGNEHIIHLYTNGVLNKEDVAKIFEVSKDYVDWLIEKWNVKPKETIATQEVTQEVIETVIN